MEGGRLHAALGPGARVSVPPSKADKRPHKHHQSHSVSSSSQAKLHTIEVAVGACLVIPPGPWPPQTAEGRGIQVTWQPPQESLPS